MNARITELRRRATLVRGDADPAMEHLRDESLRMTEGEPDVIREAKAIAHVFRNRALVISDGELIVGADTRSIHTSEGKAVPNIFGRQRFQSHWSLPEDLQRLFNAGLLSGAGNHTTIDYDTLLQIGLNGIIGRIEERIGRLNESDPERDSKVDFLTALRIAAEGYIDFCRRHADYAMELAAETESAVRRSELEAIAENCRRVPAEPPTSFWEACQSAWFCFFMLPDAPGRVDQYLYPFYKADLERGAITVDEARELLSCLWIKYFEIAGTEQAVSALHHLTLGGVTPEGNDASNDLTYLCLDVTEDLRLQRPQVGLRWHKGTPPELLRRAVRVLRTHSGNPDFCNDEQIVPALERIGIPAEDARDFSLSGCHEVIVTGRAQMGSVEGFVNLPKILLMALGIEPEPANPADLASVATFSDLKALVTREMERVAEAAHKAAVERDSQAAREPGGNILASLVVNDCIENVRGYTQGGARYNHCNWNVIGLANLADSLAAIRTIVYENRECSLRELSDVLRDNWNGHETLRQRVINRFQHFGNGQRDSDSLAADLLTEFSSIMKQYRPFRGGEYILGTTAGGENMHVEFGRMTGATPDGRLKGETFADSIGAAQGRDRNGVTAMLNSVASLPHQLLPTATTLNVKLDPKLLEGADGIGKIAALIEAHFLSGGQQCQFNMVTREMLVEAKREPEKHSDLMVRVAGYSAPFTSLWEDLQDEVMARTEHAI